MKKEGMTLKTVEAKRGPEIRTLSLKKNLDVPIKNKRVCVKGFSV